MQEPAGGLAPPVAGLHQGAWIDQVRQLDRAIDHLYEVFRGYRRPDEIDVSPLRDFEKAWQTIQSRPPRELAAEELNSYACSALTTVGNEDDFRHFLPRLLELITETQVGFGNAIFASKLPYAQWRSWPEREQAAIEAFLTAWWQAVLSSEPTIERDLVEDCLCSIANIVEDVGDYLSHWELETSESSVLGIARMINANFDRLNRKHELHGSWPKHTMAQVSSWLLRSRVRSRLEEAFFSCEDDEHARELSDASQRVEWLE